MDRADIESLVQEAYPRVFRAALVMTGNCWDAEDLTQETVLQAMRSASRFARRSSSSTWLYAILLNLHKKRLRSAGRRWNRWLRWLNLTRSRGQDMSPDAELVHEEWRGSLWSAVGALPEPQRQAIVLRYSEDLTYQQIAEVMDCPLGTVKSRIHHGLAALQTKLMGKLSFDERMVPHLESCVQ